MYNTRTGVVWWFVGLSPTASSEWCDEAGRCDERVKGRRGREEATGWKAWVTRGVSVVYI